MQKQAMFIALAILLIGSASAVQVCDVSEDFSSGSLDASKWEIRQDVEGQALTNEYWVDTTLENFHIQQSVTGDGATFLFPKYTFTTGDVLEYDVDLKSKQGSYMHIDLLTGDQYIRVGIFGWWSNSVQGYDELGVSHVKIVFEENNFHLERTAPSGVTLVDNLPLSNTNGEYNLYIGGGTGNNGQIHMDLDNFQLCHEEEEPPQPDLEERVAELEQRVEELENRTSVLERYVKRIVDFILSLPKGLTKNW